LERSFAALSTSGRSGPAVHRYHWWNTNPTYSLRKSLVNIWDAIDATSVFAPAIFAVATRPCSANCCNCSRSALRFAVFITNRIAVPRKSVSNVCLPSRSSSMSPPPEHNRKPPPLRQILLVMYRSYPELFHWSFPRPASGLPEILGMSAIWRAGLSYAGFWVTRPGHNSIASRQFFFRTNPVCVYTKGRPRALRIRG